MKFSFKAAGSVDSDVDGFVGFVGPSSSFPLMSQEGFEIMPGKLTSLEHIEEVEPNRRNFTQQYDT